MRRHGRDRAGLGRLTPSTIPVLPIQGSLAQNRTTFRHHFPARTLQRSRVSLLKAFQGDASLMCEARPIVGGRASKGDRRD
jgi:hypothetical protein